MPVRNYPWTRFWCSREGSYSLTHEGFLREPYKKHPNIGDVKTFAAIAETPVLLLLGEPGIGKTFAITAERDAIQASVAARGEQILWPDLQAISTPESFDRLVVNAPEFHAWMRGEAILHLYLDALDECMLRVRILGRLLTNALQGGPTERLWLRLTCRTAEWSNKLETDLKALLGADRVKAFELLLLTKADVASAVAANGIDQATFFDYVQRTGASALASRPVALDFLIRCFRRGDLPFNQVELYEKGCLTLCEELEHRLESGLPPAFSAAQRLAVAKRIAYYTIFSTRSVLLFGRDDSDIPADALRLSDLAGGKEHAGTSTFEVTEAAVKDALDTGLFTSRGAKVLGWAHHTYEEYLAARYVSDSTLTPQQILPLIAHPDDADRKLTPQLHQVAAWLAALHGDIMDYVLKHEPELLLLSDVVIERDEDRARLVANLLWRKREQKLALIDPMMYPKLGKLGHPKLAAQLRPVLTNRNEPTELRELVADIAEYTCCSAVIPELTQIALDRTEPIGVRIDAAGAIVLSGDEVQRAALRPLVDTSSRSREEHWLVSMGLRGAWPSALSAKELFGFLNSQRRRLGSIGEDYGLLYHILATLNDARLVPALDWVLRRVRARPEGSTIEIGDALQRLEDGIIVQAWRSDDDAVSSALAEVVIEKIRRYQRLISRDDILDEEVSDTDLTSEASRRQRFATFLLPALARRKKMVPPEMIFEKTPYLQQGDLPWLVKRQAEVPHRPQESAVEARVILSLADLTVPSMFDLVLVAAEHNVVLAEKIKKICAPVFLDSEEALEARQNQRERNERSERRAARQAEREQTQSSIDVVRWLQKTGERPCLFWRLLDEMARTPNNRYANSISLDVQSFPGWIAADDGTRRQTIRAAEQFIRDCDCNADSWFGTQQFAHSAMGGVRALMLLKGAAPQQFASLTSDIWEKWTPALLGIPNNNRTVPLLATAYRYAPDEVIRRVQQLLRTREAYIVRKLSDVMDNRLTSAILEIAAEGQMPVDTMIRLLDPLLQEKVAAREFAESLVRSRCTDNSDAIAAAVASKLLLRAPSESWRTIWPLMTEDRDFGRAVIEHAVDHDHFTAAPVYILEERRVADLYLWLTREYPPKEDPQHEGSYEPYTRDNVASWRSRCLDSLKLRGTRAACDELRRLAAQLPDQPYLLPLIVEAESVRRQKSWRPTPVVALRNLLSDRSRRQVRSETELADVIVESLTRLEAKLQGETPAAFDLWNTSPYRPKTENECSNYVARHLRNDLQDRGVILAREVEIRPTASPGSGERTDIHVDVAIEIEDLKQTFSVIVEVKGCWNSGLGGDMTSQLAHRYLRDNATRTGIFLVAWFQSAVWDNTDRRKRNFPADPAILKSALVDEATALRAEGFDIRPVFLNCSLR